MAVLAVGALAVATSVVQAPAALAATFERIAGADRYSTAVAVSQSAFPDAVPTVYVATGLGFADALAGGPAAAAGGAPLLLVARDTIPEVTREEIARLTPGRIVVLGGSGAVSAAVEQQLRGLAGTVVRIQGASRYETAANTSNSVFGVGVAVAYVASGVGFADALAGGPAAAQRGGPVLLTEGGTLPTATRTELQRLQPSSIVVLGGIASVSAEVETQLRGLAPTVRRDGSYDRYASAVAVSKQAFPIAPVPLVYLATGLSFPDALAAGAAAGKQRVPLLLTNPDCIPASVNAELNRLQPGRVVLLGGTSAIGSGVQSGIVCPESGVSRLGTDRDSVARDTGNTITRWDATTPRSISGVQYLEALFISREAGTTSESSIEFDIARGFGAFRSAVGQADDSSNTTTTVEFRLFADDVLVKSARLPYGQVEQWDVGMVGVLRVRLEAQIVATGTSTGRVGFVFGSPRVLK